ncbi:MAG TPA: hemolysin family protein [Thermoanaerobaculia bacterium]|nr:hemolysin family protein [Thermoanaerobaculia bacterium]
MIITFVILLLIAINALYVAAEFAAVAVRPSRIHQMAESSRLARTLLPVLTDARLLDRYIAACQVGITISSLVLGAYGQAKLSRSLEAPLRSAFGLGPVHAASLSAVLILIALTSLQMVLGELVPKSIAIRRPARTGLATVLPMRWSLVVLRPFIALLNGSGLAILRLFRIPVSSHRHVHSPEEIELLLDESHERGVLRREEHLRLAGALRLAKRQIRQIITPRPMMVALQADLTIEAALDEVSQMPYTRFPVYGEGLDDIAGLVHTKDLAALVLAGETGRPLASILRPALSIPETATVEDALEQMREHRTQLAIVIDEYGGTAGILSAADILRSVIGTRRGAAGAGRGTTVEPGTERLPGNLPLDELPAEMRSVWAHPGVGTVSGRVISELGRFPRQGEVVSIEGWRTEVESVQGHVVVSVLVSREPEEPA